MQQSLRILLTGASGMAATGIRPLLRDAGHKLVLLDIAEVSDLEPSETFIQGSVTDTAALSQAVTGADVVVHLGGFSRERAWADILSTNIDGTQKVLEAAQHAGVSRVLLASSTHAIGYWPVGTPAEQLLPRPDTYYGVSKVAAEALGNVFADRFGMTVVSARIGTLADEPTSERHRSIWLSYADLVRLILATATTERAGHHIVYAVSANTASWFPTDSGSAIGYVPRDNAEDWAPFPTEPVGDDAPIIGGAFADEEHPLGEER